MFRGNGEIGIRKVLLKTLNLNDFSDQNSSKIPALGSPNKKFILVLYLIDSSDQNSSKIPALASRNKKIILLLYLKGK